MSKHSYRATFRRRWYLYCLPPILAAAIAGYVTFAKPPSYTSSTSLWVDNPPPLGSSLGSTATSADPSLQIQTLLTELLATRAFVLSVGNESTLKSYLVTHTKGGTLNAAIMASIGSNTTSSVAGPQVLVVDYTGPSAAVAQSVLQKMITKLKTSSVKYSDLYVSNAMSYYDSELTSARKAARAAQAELTTYLRLHPKATSQNDPAYAALVASAFAASRQISQAKSSSTQAQGSLYAAADAPILRVVDPPSLPGTFSASRKKDAEAVVGGFVAGLLISLLVIVLLTPSRPEYLDPISSQFRAAFVAGDDLDEAAAEPQLLPRL